MATAKEIEYMRRLKERVDVLECRLKSTPPEASFRVDIQKELNATRWAYNQIAYYKHLESASR